jgi:hypothetical protein
MRPRRASLEISATSRIVEAGLQPKHRRTALQKHIAPLWKLRPILHGASDLSCGAAMDICSLGPVGVCAPTGSSSFNYFFADGASATTFAALGRGEASSSASRVI